MAVQHVWLQIEEIKNFNPVYRLKDCMRNPGHEDGIIKPAEQFSRILNALVYREYTDETYTVKKLDKLILKDINEKTLETRIGTVIYTVPETTLKIHVRNSDHEPHSFHVHGVAYGIDSDGSWPFGTQSIKSGLIRRSDEICHDESWTYTFEVDENMIGVWPFHDHSRELLDGINRGVFGAIIVAPNANEIPPEVQLPEFLQATLDNPATTNKVRRRIDLYLAEWAESPSSYPVVGPNDTLHAPIFFHVLGDPHSQPFFDRTIENTPPNNVVTINFNESTDKTYFYHCTLHPGMYGRIIVEGEGSGLVDVEIKDTPTMGFYSAEVTIKRQGSVRWTNNSRFVHTITEGVTPSTCINGRTFVGNTPTIEVAENQKIMWYVCNLDLGMLWHNFHTHGLRFKMPILKFSVINQNNDIVREDVRSIGPAESFVLETTAPNILPSEYVPNPPSPGALPYNIKGEFLFHCHVEEHMMSGLAGLIRVKGQVMLTEAEKQLIEEQIGFPEDDGTNDCPKNIDLTRCEDAHLGKWYDIEGSTEDESLPHITMMHAVLLPKTNKVLFFAYWDQVVQSRIFNLDDIGTTPYSDPDNQPDQAVPNNSQPSARRFSDIWSAAQTHLDTDEGTILVHGGFTGRDSNISHPYQGKQSFLFHPANLGTGNPCWEFLGGTDYENLVNQTTDGRFYASTLTLNDGRALTLFGDFNGVNDISFSIEIFNLNSLTANKWETFIQLPDQPWPYRYYPWTYQLPDGELFIAGPEAETMKLDYNNPSSFVQYPGTAGDRDPDQAYQEGTSALLPLRLSNSYAAKFIIAGGGNDETMSSVQVIDLSGDMPAWQNVTLGLKYPRRFQTDSVILADGTILFCGGAVNSLNVNEHVPGRSEIYDPETGTMKVAAQNLHARGYHSAAILLPDGSVILGGDNFTLSYDGAITRCELYKPHYFFKERPKIINFPDPPPTFNYTNDIVIDIDPAIDQSKIIEAAFIKPGAVTHGYNSTQRYVEAEITVRNIPNNSITIKAPPDGFIAPPGWYMLVILTGGLCEEEEDECGKVPSTAKWIRITP